MQIKGIQNCLNALKFDDSMIQGLVTEAGENILASVKSGMSSVDSVVASSYNMTVTRDENGWVLNVGSDIDLSAYYEFGTGEYVVVPPETTDAYTMQWFVNGKGTLRPHAVFFPAVRVEMPKLVNALNEALRKQY